MATQIRTTQTAHLPLIDIEGLVSPDPARRQAVGAAMRAACIDKGFMYVTGHGVPERLMDETFALSRDFFALPLGTKQSYDVRNAIARRGYAGIRTQAFQLGPADLKESFFFGEELPLDEPRVVRGLYDHGPNQWPAELPAFQPVMYEYWRQMMALSERLLVRLALSLGLPEPFFDGFKRAAMCPVRLLHYPPPQDDSPLGEVSFGAHTDFGGMTVLAQDAAGGLQIQGEEGDWIDATPVPGAFIVNLGDFVQRWTNDLYRSTLHRVVSNGGARYSIAAFYDGNPEYRVETLPGCISPGEAAKYPPTTMIEYLEMRARRSQVDYGEQAF